METPTFINNLGADSPAWTMPNVLIYQLLRRVSGNVKIKVANTFISVKMSTFYTVWLLSHPVPNYPGRYSAPAPLQRV